MPPKRKSTAASPDVQVKSQKRRRLDAYVPETDETAEETTKIGLRILEIIRQSKDKHGRLIAPEFESLPAKEDAPLYYKAIALPLSLELIEHRLRTHHYRQLTHLECDLRRMVTNAKHYNENGSLVFSNAERIRKILVAEFPPVNPAYKDPNYVPFSTPLPERKEGEGEEVGDGGEGESVTPSGGDKQVEEQRGEGEKKERGRRKSGRAGEKEKEEEKEKEKGEEKEKDEFEGLEFEAAQEKIISDLIKTKDETGLEIYYNFISKPDKSLYKAYYDIIAHPVSLRAILKLVRGTDNRKNSLKRSPFRSWAAFHDEVSYLWRNAGEFNEPGSDIVQEAEMLKRDFEGRLERARRVVPEPPHAQEEEIAAAAAAGAAPAGPRLKLKMGSTPGPAAPVTAATETPQRIMLRLGKKDDGTAAAASETPAAEAALKDKSAEKEKEKEKEKERHLTVSTPARSLRERPPRSASQVSSRKDASPVPGSKQQQPQQTQQQRQASVKDEAPTPTAPRGAVPATVPAQTQTQPLKQAAYAQPQAHAQQYAAAHPAATTGQAPGVQGEYYARLQSSAQAAGAGGSAGGLVGGATGAMTTSVTPAAAPQGAAPAPAGQTQDSKQSMARRNKARKGTGHPLLSTVEIFTHPDFLAHRKHTHYSRAPPQTSTSTPPSPPPFHISIPPSKTSTQQSITLTLPPTTHTLRLIPTIIPSTLHRQTTLSVTAAGHKLAPSSSGAMHAAQFWPPPPTGTTHSPHPPPQPMSQPQSHHDDPSAPLELAKPSYDVRLAPGVTRIALEIVGRNLAKTRGLTMGSDPGEVDFESLTVFVHLLRS